jgi:hypothetical protein
MDLVPFEKKTLTRTQFEQLADVPPEEGLHKARCDTTQ